MTAIVRVSDLVVTVPAPGDVRRRIVDGVSLTVGAGESVSLVGESGAGKTITGLALTRLLPEPARIDGGLVTVAGIDVRTASESELDRMRGTVVGYVFQEPAAALDPLRSVTSHVAEGIRARRGGMHGQAIADRVEALLAEVGLDDVSEIRRAFPHQLSGGQRQRVLIAAALAGDPSLLVLDEPTSALDTVATAHFVDLLDRLQKRRGFATVFISHDLALVGRVSSRVVVVYAGETVEEGESGAVISAPLHPYTGRLVGVREREVRVRLRPADRPPGDSVGATRARCRFASVCPEAFESCRAARPALTAVDPARRVRCFLWHTTAERRGDDG